MNKMLGLYNYSIYVIITIFTLIAVIALTATILTSCGKKDKNIVFKAVVVSVAEKSLLVNTVNFDTFDKATVGTTADTKIVDWNNKKLTLSALRTDDIVEITILPEIRESYPVQVTALKIELFERRDGILISPEKTTATSQYRKITAKEAKEIMDRDKSAIILDVRTQSEYDEGHIEGSILLPVTEIAAKAQFALPNKGTTILVYCRSGNRSKTAAEELIKLGYTGVNDFGGIIDWPYGTVK